MQNLVLELILPAVETFAELYTSDEPALLQALSLETQAAHPKAHMLSGKLQGRFLAMISQLMQPQRILEIGTFTGYSALCLAEGLAPNGQLHTIECRAEDAATAQRYFNQSPFAKQIHLHIGNAIELLEDLTECWDIVFLDADKTGYSAYYEAVLPRLRKGGLLIADNMLFHGQVLAQPLKGKNPQAIQAFLQKLSKDERVTTSFVTLRDGLLLVRKK